MGADIKSCVEVLWVNAYRSKFDISWIYENMFYIYLYICNLHKDFKATSILWTQKDLKWFQQNTIDKTMRTVAAIFLCSNI